MSVRRESICMNRCLRHFTLTELTEVTHCVNISRKTLSVKHKNALTKFLTKKENLHCHCYSLHSGVTVWREPNSLSSNVFKSVNHVFERLNHFLCVQKFNFVRSTSCSLTQFLLCYFFVFFIVLYDLLSA